MYMVFISFKHVDIIDFEQKTRDNLASMMPDDVLEGKTRFFKLRNFYEFDTGKSLICRHIPLQLARYMR